MRLQHHFVFGYGSLICRNSRSVTVPEQANRIATPVVVSGLERVWSKRSPQTGMTSMGVRFKHNATCVGVLLSVNMEELQRLDQREKGYSRVRLHLDAVDKVPFLEKEHYQHQDHKKFLNAKKGNDANDIAIWVYVPNRHVAPSPECPIVQSYVDTILRGCLSIHKEFAKNFITTTKGWSPEELTNAASSKSDEQTQDDDNTDEAPVWIDDRQNPIYIRGDPEYSREYASDLDRLLHQYRPEPFANRESLMERCE